MRQGPLPRYRRAPDQFYRRGDFSDARAERLGADAALLVAPYYNKPSQEGLYRHYRAIAGAVGIPIILYSIPGRCGIEIAVETVARLATDCTNIVGIKASRRFR